MLKIFKCQKQFFCEDCKKPTSIQWVGFKSRCCRSCNNIKRWKQKGYKEKIAKKISETRIKLGLAVGEKNPKWNGGVTPLRIAIRSYSKYKKWRDKIYKRDNWTCGVCGKRGSDIEADHHPISMKNIISVYKIKDYKTASRCKLLWDINNGRTLCVNCHFKKHHNGKTRKI